MNNLINNLRNKPLKTRKKIMWTSVSFCALSIFFFWLFLAPHEAKNKHTSSLDFSKIKEGFNKRIDKSGLKNISGGIKEATREIINSDEKNDVATNEIPRLPMEIE